VFGGGGNVIANGRACGPCSERGKLSESEAAERSQPSTLQPQEENKSRRKKSSAGACPKKNGEKASRTDWKKGLKRSQVSSTERKERHERANNIKAGEKGGNKAAEGAAIS